MASNNQGPSMLKTLLSHLGLRRDPPAPACDPAAIESREQAQALFQAGRLDRALLFPLALGGQDHEANAVYLPLGLAAMKQRLDATLLSYAEQGLITKLTIEPQYKGRSVIPARIVMKGSNPEREGSFEPVLEVW